MFVYFGQLVFLVLRVDGLMKFSQNDTYSSPYLAQVDPINCVYQVHSLRNLYQLLFGTFSNNTFCWYVLYEWQISEIDFTPSSQRELDNNSCSSLFLYCGTYSMMYSCWLHDAQGSTVVATRKTFEGESPVQWPVKKHFTRVWQISVNMLLQGKLAFINFLLHEQKWLVKLFTRKSKWCTRYIVHTEDVSFCIYMKSQSVLNTLCPSLCIVECDCFFCSE